MNERQISYSGPDRRSNTVDRKLTELEVKVQGVEKTVFEVRVRQDVNNAQTAEIHEIVTTAKGFFKTLQAAGRVAKPLLWIGALCSAIAVGFKTGVWTFKG